MPESPCQCEPVRLIDVAAPNRVSQMSMVTFALRSVDACIREAFLSRVERLGVLVVTKLSIAYMTGRITV